MLSCEIIIYDDQCQHTGIFDGSHTNSKSMPTFKQIIEKIVYTYFTLIKFIEALCV